MQESEGHSENGKRTELSLSRVSLADFYLRNTEEEILFARKISSRFRGYFCKSWASARFRFISSQSACSRPQERHYNERYYMIDALSVLVLGDTDMTNVWTEGSGFSNVMSVSRWPKGLGFFGIGGISGSWGKSRTLGCSSAFTCTSSKYLWSGEL